MDTQPLQTTIITLKNYAEQHERIRLFISTLQDSANVMPFVFTTGGAFKLYELLHILYPKAVPYCSEGHVITEIDGVYYDINGEYNDGRFFNPHTKETGISGYEVMPQEARDTASKMSCQITFNPALTRAACG